MTSSISQRLVVEMRASPQFDAFEAWRASLATMYFDATLREPARRGEFKGSITGFNLGESLIFNSACAGLRTVRDARFARRSHIDHLMIEYQVRGRRHGRFGERSIDVKPGDISFLDFGRTLDSVETDFTRVSLIVPRERLPRNLRDRDLHGLVLGRLQSGALGRFLELLTRSADILEAAAAVEIALALADRASGTAVSLDPRPETRAAFLALAKDHIEETLMQPGLSPSAIAAALGISRATLYRLFAMEGGIEAYVVGRRLDRCFDHLLRRSASNVGAIALSNGFASEAHFSRAFRQRFRLSPREIRGLAAASRRVTLRPDGAEALAVSNAWVRGLSASPP